MSFLLSSTATTVWVRYFQTMSTATNGTCRTPSTGSA